MANEFLLLSTQDQYKILKTVAAQTETQAEVLEKDIWLCWALDKLFKLPLQMAFKGGTSLSKVFHVINRFSEDLDINIDYQNFIPGFSLTEKISNTQLKKISAQLKSMLKERVEQTIVPHLKNEFFNGSFQIEVSEDGEAVKLYYPSLFENAETYLKNYILIEFGARNTVSPNETHSISSILAENIPELKLPEATIKVLSPLRTFWEKATLIHVECHRGRLENTPERLARHWYDLAMLSTHWIGKQAIQNKELLHDVVSHKKIFYQASYSNYDHCLNNQLRLIPDVSEISALEQDYKLMQSSGMFPKTPISFQEIISILKETENSINK